MQENRHHIKTRMLKTASRAWGFPETQAETAFDPVIGILMSACAAELEKISSEIYSSRARITERIIQLLAPDVLTGALPAHAVACSTPVENKSLLTEQNQFYVRRKGNATAGTEEATGNDLYFSPSGSFRLNKASIRFMATGNQLYKMGNAISRELVAQSYAGSTLPPAAIFLGIDNPDVCLHQSQFYFDFRNEAEKTLFYQHLPEASWAAGEQTLTTVAGYAHPGISGERLEPETILGRDYDVGNRLKKTVNAFYKSCFVTILDTEERTVQKEEDRTAEMLFSTFSGKEVEGLQKLPIRWLRIQFHQSVPNHLLQDVVCTMNAFPVINRRLMELNYRLQDSINIVPLFTEDLFFDLDEVSDEEGRQLNVRSLNSDAAESSIMLLRNGGVGRFDERDASAFIHNLLQLLRDESAAFSALGNDFVGCEVKQLQQIINRLDQRLNSIQVHQEQNPYLVIRNKVKNPRRSLYVQYWSTNGREGNNIKAGTPLQLYKGDTMEGNQVILVTTTQGGRNKLDTTDSMLAYKTALLSKDRIISAEDAKAFCHYKLGDRVIWITVKKGVMIHPGEQKGFLKTIDVIIDIKKESYNQMQELGELDFWEANLKMMLEQKSAAYLPYRVFLQRANS